MRLSAMWVSLLSLLANISKLIPMGIAYVFGRRSIANEQNEKVIDIKTRQTKKALDMPDRSTIIDILRDDDKF